MNETQKWTTLEIARIKTEEIVGRNSVRISGERRCCELEIYRIITEELLAVESRGEEKYGQRYVIFLKGSSVQAGDLFLSPAKRGLLKENLEKFGEEIRASGVVRELGFLPK